MHPDARPCAEEQSEAIVGEIALVTDDAPGLKHHLLPRLPTAEMKRYPLAVTMLERGERTSRPGRRLAGRRDDGDAAILVDLDFHDGQTHPPRAFDSSGNI
jgi:hypothetical protein